MAAIRNLKSTVEPEIDAITMDVAFLRADVKKISEKVAVVETHINVLQSTTKRLEGQRAHGASVPPPRPRTPPRTIITRIFNYQDTILHAARSHGDLQYKNSTIRFFLDFTMQMQQQHYSLEEVKKELCFKDLKYMMLYPAKLLLLVEGKLWYVNTPAEEWELIKDRRLLKLRSSRESKRGHRLSHATEDGADTLMNHPRVTAEMGAGLTGEGE
ncbi:hypothetical protein NDU88_003714 [Pleurodeles waltl]|uniref:Uncharacterized protein n=1 Tax=Pleurodeles waltl TaxID=8319 RepID=A0AAV7MRH3_PLEWA|nr:hypothetical protein NDU88_003714 [Pleurodeles waltl]